MSASRVTKEENAHFAHRCFSLHSQALLNEGKASSVWYTWYPVVTHKMHWHVCTVAFYLIYQQSVKFYLSTVDLT